MTTLRISPLLVALALALPVAADTISVPLGSSLKAAVAAAQPGDTLVLQAGQYVDSGSLVIDKSLTLIGAGSSATAYSVVTSFPFTAPLPLAIQNIDASEEVRVIGLRLVAQPSPNLSASIAAISACAGPVSLADVSGSSVYGSSDFGVVPATVRVQNAAHVALSSCNFAGGAGPYGTNAAIGTQGLHVENSNVWISASTIQGGPGAGSLNGVGAPGAAAIVAQNSTLRIGRCKITGGAGKSGVINFFTTGAAGDGAPGIIAQNSTIQLRGGPTNMLRGGPGSSGMLQGQPDFGSGAECVHLDASSLLTWTIDSVIAPGVDGDGIPSVGSFTGPGTFTVVEQRLATMLTWPLVAELGSTSTSEIAGEPFGIGVVGFAIAQSSPLTLGGILGPVVLDLGALQLLPPFALGEFGIASRTTPLPSTPSLAGLTVISQGLAVSPLGVLSVSAPVAQAFLH